MLSGVDPKQDDVLDPGEIGPIDAPDMTEFLVLRMKKRRLLHDWEEGGTRHARSDRLV